MENERPVELGEASATTEESTETSSPSFVDLKLTGGRFDRTGFPVSGLAELERLEELISTVAKCLWKRDNPDRIRIPNNFMSQFDLRLVRVDKGSVLPVMQRGGSEALFTTTDYFDASMSVIEDAFAEIINNMRLPAGFPEEAASVMARFGSSFSEDERAIFRASGNQPVVYSLGVRKRFFGSVRQGLLVQTGAHVGRISALDVDEQTFIFTGLDGKRVTGVYGDAQLWSDLRLVLKQQADNCWVRLQGSYRVRPDASVHSIADVQSIEIFDVPETEPWSRRLLELADLQDGWIDDGEAISTASLEFARDLLQREVVWKNGVPGIFPTPDGGVQLEWSLGGDRFVVRIGSDLAIEARRSNRLLKERTHKEPNEMEELITILEEWSL